MSWASKDAQDGRGGAFARTLPHGRQLKVISTQKARRLGGVAERSEVEGGWRPNSLVPCKAVIPTPQNTNIRANAPPPQSGYARQLPLSGEQIRGTLHPKTHLAARG